METFGFMMAILMALFAALKMISMKNNLKNIDSNSLIFLLSGFSVIVLLPFIFIQGIPDLSLKFWGVFFLSGTLYYVGKLFHFKALQLENISYISPLKGLINLGVIIVGMVLLKEVPNFLGWVGNFIVLSAIYTLNLQKYHTKFLEPILHLFHNKGAQLYFITVICYSFTTVFDKVGVLESYPIFWVFMMNMFLFIMSFKNFIKNYSKNKVFLFQKYKSIFLTFIFYLLSNITQMIAVQYIFASYVSIIKSSSMIFTIVLGGLFFNEKNLVRKFIIALFIIFGIVLIYFSK